MLSTCLDAVVGIAKALMVERITKQDHVPVVVFDVVRDLSPAQHPLLLAFNAIRVKGEALLAVPAPRVVVQVLVFPAFGCPVVVPLLL